MVDERRTATGGLAFVLVNSKYDRPRKVRRFQYRGLQPLPLLKDGELPTGSVLRIGVNGLSGRTPLVARAIRLRGWRRKVIAKWHRP